MTIGTILVIAGVILYTFGIRLMIEEVIEKQNKGAEVQ